MARRGDDTAPVQTIFLAAGRSSAIHRHDESTAWLHVVTGEIVEERWTRDTEGGFIYERRKLRRGQSMAAPADVLHRVTAIEEAAFISTCLCDCCRANAADASEIDAVMRLTRDEGDREWALTTMSGSPAPAA
jgi:uncharacterized cupin superfamily protein